MANLKRHRGWGALALTAAFAGGYTANQVSRPPSCLEIDEAYLPQALDLARDYSRAAKSQLVFLSNNNESSMYFEPSKLRPADVTDEKLDELNGIYNQATALSDRISQSEQNARCLLSRSSTTRMQVSAEIREVMQKIGSMLQENPKAFDELKKYRPPENTTAPAERENNNSMPLAAPLEPTPLTA